MSLARSLWPLVPISAIALCAFFGAQTLSHALSVELLPEDSVSEAPEDVPATYSPPRPRALRSKDGRALVETNMFCPHCEPGELAPPTNAARATHLPLRLIATQRSDRSEHSFATLVHTELGRQGSYGVGELVPGGAVLHAVHLDRVELRVGVEGDIEVLGFDDPPRVEKRAAPKRASASSELIEDHVRVLSATHLEVDRALVEKLRSNPMLAGARMRPVANQGVMRGVKLYAVRRSGPVYAMGLRNGDVVEAANGVKLSSLESGLELMGQLATRDHWSFEIERGGERIEMEVELQ